jgi:hypothetical protein
MLAFLSLLISLDVFEEVYLSFLLVPHEDIDQLFSTAQTKFHYLSIHTPGYLSAHQSAFLLSCHTIADVHQQSYLLTIGDAHHQFFHIHSF